MLAGLYDIDIKREEGEGKYTCEVVLNPEHAVYEGHFPGMPVTPGVCLLHMVKTCASQITDSRLRYNSISSCKFLAVVDPTRTTKLLVTIEIAGDGLLRASANVDDTPVLKLKAKLIKA